METDTDKIVLELLQRVKQKQKEIADSERPHWETSCSVGMTDNVNDKVNIQTVTDLNKLVSLYAFLSEKEKSLVAAKRELGVDVKLSWQGHSFADWKKDFKARIEQIGLNRKRADLRDLEARVEKLVTPEQRRQIELEAIQKELSN
jgi:hypothetical protein